MSAIQGAGYHRQSDKNTLTIDERLPLLATRDPACAAALKAALHGAGPWSLQPPVQGLADIRQA